MANVIQTFPKGSGGGGGHTILDSEGTAVAQESKLQFKGVSVTDNSTDGITEFEGEGLNADSIDDIADAAPVVPAVVIGDANNYSTTEKVIGKWIDGKPIYQKTYSLTTPSTTNDVAIGSFDSSCIVREMTGFVEDTSTHTYLPIMFKYGDDSNNYITVYITASGIRCKVASGYTSKPVYLTVKYTKTTD